MWIARDIDNIIIGTNDHLYDFILFNKKSDIISLVSSNYLDGRKKLQVKKINKGYYIYYPKNCDGYKCNEVEIFSIQYLKENYSKKYSFLEKINELLKNILEEKNIIEKNEYNYKNLINLEKNLYKVKKILS